MTTADLLVNRTALFSGCGCYRYTLGRTWAAFKPHMVFIMLNPSLADTSRDDPTVTRCMERARRMGYGGIIVLNAFALISPYPKDLHTVADPVGPDNDANIREVIAAADRFTVAGWGKIHTRLRDRARQVKWLVQQAGVRLHCLGINSDGSPKHPLYVGYDVQPVPLVAP